MSRTALIYFLTAIAILAVSCSDYRSDEMSPADSTRIASPSPETGISKETPDKAEGGGGNQIYEGRHNALTKAVQEVSPAVVSIIVTEVRQVSRMSPFEHFFNPFLRPGQKREYSSMGSGFIISEDGLVVTNEHVANKNAKKVMVSLTDGSQYEAEILGADELADLALLRIKADRKFPSVTFGNSDSVMVGEWSLAVGNPFGLFESGQPTVTVGVVSATNRDFRPNPDEPRVYIDMIQTDAAINVGNSGGPLVNSAGEVIGVNTFIFTGGTSSGFVGLGFAIPSNRVEKIIEQLAASGEVHMSYDTGMETTEMTYQLVRKYNLPAVPGLLVTSVNKDGPAFACGIMPGDIILKIGDEHIQSKMHMQALFREYAKGDTMRVELIRDNKRYETKMKLRPKVKAD